MDAAWLAAGAVAAYYSASVLASRTIALRRSARISANAITAMASRGAVTGAILNKITQGMPQYTAGQLQHFRKLLQTNGVEKLLQSRATLKFRIAEHLEKIRTATGYTSSMEREIRNFQQQINAIDKVLLGL